ncbi:MAG: hypothetical protein WAM82_18865 [Thermoanaerobaculia bacterium]
MTLPDSSAPVSLRTRWIVIAPSGLCFLAACACPALEFNGKEHSVMLGAQALFQGPLAFLVGQFAWLANPLELLAVVLVLRRRFWGATAVSFLGFAVANHAWALLGREIPGDEGGVTKLYLSSFHLGFFLWLLSFLLLAAGASAAQGDAFVPMRLSVEARRIVLTLLQWAVLAELVTAFVPFAWWTLFLVAALRARLYLGFWPSYDRPDPKQIPLDAGPLPEWVEPAAALLVLAALAGVSMIVMARRVPKRWWLWTAVAVWLLAWGCAYGILRWDPWGFIDWALD